MLAIVQDFHVQMQTYACTWMEKPVNLHIQTKIIKRSRLESTIQISWELELQYTNIRFACLAVYYLHERC